MAREKSGQCRKGSKRERVEEVCLLHGKHEGCQVYVIDLEHLTSELLGRHIASKEGPRQQDREKNRLLQQAGDEVQYTVWPGPQEPRTVRETVAKDGARDTKGDQELY